MGIGKMVSNEFVDIIEWLQSDDETIVYRFPRYRNEIKYGAKLTVREGQTAIFVNEGKVADVFPPGIYELKTANLPVLSTLQNWHHGFESPFKAEVYFFNTTNFLSQKWGTKQPVMLNDAQFGVVRLRAFGSYTLRVSDAEKLLKTLVGTDGNFEISEVSEQLTSSVASYFPEILAESKIGVMELPTRYSEMSEQLKQRLSLACQEYGLDCGQVFVESISLPENVQKMLDEKTNINILGNDINKYTQMQAAKGLAEGGGGNAMVDSGMGMAMGMEMGRQMVEGMRQNDQASRPAAQHAHDDVPPPPPASSYEPPALEKIYYLMLLGQRVGPMTISEVYHRLDLGEADGHTLIWRKGMGEWDTIENVPDIDLRHLPPPPPSE